MSEAQPSTYRQTIFYRALVGTALAMISFGQFNDTKELLTGLYDDITTNFTHTLEYEKLEALNIGRTINYVEAFFGPPEVLKASNEQGSVVFQYYNIEKAVVTILNQAGRIAGFVVIPTDETFSPLMPYSESILGTEALESINPDVGDYFFDASNLVYFAESQDLGKQYLFLQRVTGFVEYGELSLTLNESETDKQQSIRNIRQLNALYLAEEEERLLEELSLFRGSQAANFYAYTELDSALIAESLLTRFEFNTYFGVGQ